MDNKPQSLNETWHNLPKIMEGDIGDIITDLESGAVDTDKDEEYGGFFIYYQKTYLRHG